MGATTATTSQTATAPRNHSHADSKQRCANRKKDTQESKEIKKKNNRKQQKEMKTKNVDHDLLPARHSTSPGCETPSSAFWAKTRHHGLGLVETTLNRGRYRPHRSQQPRSASAPCELQRATCATNSNTAARLLRIPLGSQGYKRQNESGMHAPVRHRITSSAHKKHNARTRARVHTYIQIQTVNQCL